jgi:hypothetical protein
MLTMRFLYLIINDAIELFVFTTTVVLVGWAVLKAIHA